MRVIRLKFAGREPVVGEVQEFEFFVARRMPQRIVGAGIAAEVRTSSGEAVGVII